MLLLRKIAPKGSVLSLLLFSVLMCLLRILSVDDGTSEKWASWVFSHQDEVDAFLMKESWEEG